MKESLNDSKEDVLPRTNISKQRIIKNLIVISCSCLLTFTSHDGLLILQSTMNKEKGIGVISLAISFASSCLSALLLPKYLIKKFGCKTVIVATMISFLPFVASNFYPHWIAMVPASVIVGIGFSLLWSSHCSYLNDLSTMYANPIEPSHTSCYGNKAFEPCEDNASKANSIEDFSNFKPNLENRHTSCYENKAFEPCEDNASKANSIEDFSNFKPNLENRLESSKNDIYIKIDFDRALHLAAERNSKSQSVTKGEDQPKQAQVKAIGATTARFFGFHAMMYQSCMVTSSLISYYVFQSDSIELKHGTNSTCSCGPDYCNVESECSKSNLQPPPTETKYILLSIFAALSILSVIVIIIFLDTLKLKCEGIELSLDLLLATCKRVKERNQLLLIPLTLFIGMGQGFYLGDFTKAYIACAWGIRHVAIVTVCCGVTMGLSSTVSGLLIKHLRRLPVFVVTLLIDIAELVILIQWKPDPSYPTMSFISSGLWGVLFGTLWSQVRAFYGVLFKADEEAAFASYQLWHSIGCCLSLAYSNYICTNIKVYILLAVSLLGFAGYFAVERFYSIDVSCKKASSK